MVNESSAVHVLLRKDLGPKLWLTTRDEVPGLLLVHGVGIGDGDELFVAESFGICDVCEVGPRMSEYLVAI